MSEDTRVTGRGAQSVWVPPERVTAGMPSSVDTGMRVGEVAGRVKTRMAARKAKKAKKAAELGSRTRAKQNQSARHLGKNIAYTGGRPNVHLPARKTYRNHQP